MDPRSRLLRLLLFAYPEEFRARHGQELAELYRDTRAEVGGLRFWLGAFADALWSGTVLRAEQVWRDARFGAVSLMRIPGYTAVILMTLALGTGAATAVFSVIDGVLLRPLPYQGGDRVIHLLQPAPGANVENAAFSPPEVRDYREQAQSIEGVVEFHSMLFTLLGGEEPLRVQTAVVSAKFFDVMGVQPLMGRNFREEDDVPGAPPVLLVSYEFWRQKLGGDPHIVGRSFVMNDRSHQVIGVLPAIPQYPRESDVYMPTVACPFRAADRWNHNRVGRGLSVFARLKSGVSLDAAVAELNAIAKRLHAAYPKEYPASAGFRVGAVQLREELVRNARPTLLVLFTAAGLLLLLVCANVGNLTLARFARRERELAVRAALGATRSRLFRQLLTESVMLALAGGLLGIAAAYLGLDVLTAWAARFTPRAREIGIDGRVLVFSLSVSLATGIFLGTLPALPLRADLHGALKDPPPPPEAAGLRLRGLLIVVQVAMSFTLLIGAGLMLRSFLKLQSTNAGFETQNVLTARFFLHWTRYDSLAKTQAFTRGVLSRLEGQPGVVSVAATSNLPLNEGPQFNGAIHIEGKAESPDDPGLQADYHLASPDYFRTLGVPLLAGRAFEATDDDKAPWVAVVSQSLARRAWGRESPLGKRMRVEGFDKVATIVGVAGDVKERGLQSEKTDLVYLPLSTVSWNEQRVLVRGTATPAAIERQIRAAIRELDREVPLNDVRTLEELRSESVAAPRLTAFLLSLFASLALAITAAGIAGVIAYSVSQRTRELGIRLALGAAPGEVLQMVLRQGMTLVVVGLSLGAVGAVLLSRLLSALLFGVVAGDPLTFVAVSAVLFGVGLLSCLLPARRVTALDPALALRST